LCGLFVAIGLKHIRESVVYKPPTFTIFLKLNSRPRANNKKITPISAHVLMLAACTIIFCMILLGIGVGMGFGWHRMDSLFLGGMIAPENRQPHIPTPKVALTS